jgi:dolichol-phosphate mannosyltransferase
VIFVDDGSGDNSLAELLELRDRAPGVVRIVKLTRNFGQPYARLAGYAHCRGRCAIHLTADLQDPPELINDMLDAHFNERYEIVIAERIGRDESLYRRITSRLSYHLIRKLCFPSMPVGGFDFHLISDKVRRLILESNEANPFFQGQVLWTGYRFKSLPYTRRRREIGRSRWTLGKKLKLLIDSVLSYSYFPLRLMSALGVATSLIGFLVAAFLLVRRLLGIYDVQGWAALMVVTLILAGGQMLMLGVIGEYLWRTLDQVKGRRPYIVEEVYN